VEQQGDEAEEMEATVVDLVEVEELETLLLSKIKALVLLQTLSKYVNSNISNKVRVPKEVGKQTLILLQLVW
jgi:hypothetical protein